MLDRFKDICDRGGKLIDWIGLIGVWLGRRRRGSISGFRQYFSRCTYTLVRAGITYERNRGEIRRCRGNNRQERGEEGWLAKNERLVNSFRASAARISRSV